MLLVLLVGCAPPQKKVVAANEATNVPGLKVVNSCLIVTDGSNGQWFCWFNGAVLSNPANPIEVHGYWDWAAQTNNKSRPWAGSTRR
jgi:hypothetical protein